MPTRICIKNLNDEANILSVASPTSPVGSIISSQNQNPSFRRGRMQSLSSRDISASSRLSGYLFIFTAYVVLFVSSFKYESIEDKFTDALAQDVVAEHVIDIKEWKRLSAMVGSASFVGLMVLIVGVHFDTMIARKLWLKIFRDGSMGEAIILTILNLGALFMVYVCTSINGIGGFAGTNYNVYFSSWLGFFACVYTFGLWNTAASQRNVNITFSLRYSTFVTQRKTVKGWIWTMFFSLVTFFSLLEMFLLSENFDKPVGENQLAIMLLCSSGCVFCCLLVLFMNALCSWCQCLCHWHKIELVILVILIGFWTWAVFRFTGINGLVNGPGNSYFGAWGSFACSISIFGSWKADYKNDVMMV